MAAVIVDGIPNQVVSLFVMKSNPHFVSRKNGIGYFAPNGAERMAGMAIRYDEDAEPSETILCGQLRDQAALLGVLNALYSLQLPLLSVRYLAEE